MLLSRTARFAFDEKLKPGENHQTRALRGSAGTITIQQWETEGLKHIQSKEWQDRFDSIMQRTNDMAKGV